MSKSKITQPGYHAYEHVCRAQIPLPSSSLPCSIPSLPRPPELSPIFHLPRRKVRDVSRLLYHFSLQLGRDYDIEGHSTTYCDYLSILTFQTNVIPSRLRSRRALVRSSRPPSAFPPPGPSSHPICQTPPQPAASHSLPTPIGTRFHFRRLGNSILFPCSAGRFRPSLCHFATPQEGQDRECETIL